jgi:hypothetical protein
MHVDEREPKLQEKFTPCAKGASSEKFMVAALLLRGW